MQRRQRTAVVAAALALIVAGAATGCFALRDVMLSGPPSVGSATPTYSPPGSGTDGDGRHSLTLLAAGDVLPHPEMWHQASRDGNGKLDFFPMFAHTAATISAADLAICHLEPPLGPAAGPFLGFPRFSVPPQVAGAIRRAGFDACSTASNHAIDQGEAGVIRTIDALDQAGLAHTGTFKTAAEALTPTIYDVTGVPVAHLSYAMHFNGLVPPAGKEWIANQIDVNAILAAARQARQAGAQIVVVSMHWGTEYQHEPDVEQQTWAKSVILSPDVDVILGHHAHVVQPVEIVSGKWIIYGMGNQLARHAEPVNDNREGVMMRLRFTEVSAGQWQVTRVEAVPIWVDLNPDIRLIDLAKAVADPGIPASKRAIFAAALDRIRGHLTSRGADQVGLTVLGAG